MRYEIENEMFCHLKTGVDFLAIRPASLAATEGIPVGFY